MPSATLDQRPPGFAPEPDGERARVQPELLPAGTVLADKYRLIRRLGIGGMGSVYEARHEVTQKRVAIKCLHAALAQQPEHVRRVLREAQAAARIRHPNVVDVYDVGRHGDSVFLVMELLEGETLGRLMQRRRLSATEFIALLLPAMRGVAMAHAQGVIHRDIKPENIFLARIADALVPVPKVVDFGVSKLGAAAGTADLTLTESGVALGTPRYMSIEQLRGERDLDGRCDVYAFGAILYQGITHQLPFQADSFGELAIRVATEVPAPPTELVADLPAGLDGVLLKALARRREDRFSSLDAFIGALEPFALTNLQTGNHDTLPLSTQAPWVPEPRPTVSPSSSDAHGVARRPDARFETGSARGPGRARLLTSLCLLLGLGATAYAWLSASAPPTPQESETRAEATAAPTGAVAAPPRIQVSAAHANEDLPSTAEAPGVAPRAPALEAEARPVSRSRAVRKGPRQPLATDASEARGLEPVSVAPVAAASEVSVAAEAPPAPSEAPAPAPRPPSAPSSTVESNFRAGVPTLKDF
jgi:serine/threonine protein kinase